MLLICRFAVNPVETDSFVRRARRALGLLTTQPGCLGGQLGRSPDEVAQWALVVRFESMVAYRRALSPFEIREHVIPLLSEALTSQCGGYEVLVTAENGAVSDYDSVLASAADQRAARESRRGNGPEAR